VTFAPGDKVMQIENDYEKEVYNGDIGTIDDVDSNSGELIASFDGRSVTYGFGELDMLVPAYAATIHKSQGSEYPAVIIPGQGVRADWSGASHSRSRRARRERHATETPGQPRQRAGGHAPQPAGPSDAARPNRTLSAGASNAAPTPTALEVRSLLKSA
jgi:hypothetical protein